MPSSPDTRKNRSIGREIGDISCLVMSFECTPKECYSGL